MTYLITTNHHGDPETFRTIAELVDPHAHGLVARYAGMNDFGLAITAVWESKADADRFTAEHLFPALQTIGGDQPAGESIVIEFTAFDALTKDGAA